VAPAYPSEPGDVNGDGLGDLLVGRPYSRSGNVVVMLADPEMPGMQNYSVSDIIGPSWDWAAIAPEQQSPESVQFGASVSFAGDIDGDGVLDAVAGAPGLGQYNGGLFVLFMNANGTCSRFTVVANGQGGIGNVIPTGSHFGFGVIAGPHVDLNGDSIPDVIVGAPAIGRIMILTLSRAGTALSYHEYSPNQDVSYFGWSMVSMGYPRCVRNSAGDQDCAMRIAVSQPYPYSSGSYDAASGLIYVLDVTATNGTEIGRIGSQTGGIVHKFPSYV